MTKNLTQRITQSLERTIHRALLIKGKNDTGKSYYIKNNLFPKVRETATSIHHETYYPVLISLFGIKSIEEIKEQLFFEVLPLLKNKNSTVPSDIGMFLTKMFNNINIEQHIDQEQSLLELFFTKENSSSSKVNLLLCFDDLNRTSDILQSKELFGFINNILENTAIKVILIETDNELADVAFDYTQMKRKVIGDMIQFEIDFTLIYEQIITEKYKEKSPNYFHFLQDRSQAIISKIEDCNVTTLLFFLEHYEVIFTTIEEVLAKDEKPKLSRERYFNKTLNYTLSIATELKIGRLTPNVIFGLRHENDESNVIKTPLDADITQEELELYEDFTSYQQNYEEKYFNNINYNPIAVFNSIFEYVVGYSFISKNLVNELKPFRVFCNYPTFSKLFDLEVLDLPMSEIDTLIDEMLILVDNAEFYLGEYASVFDVVTRFFYTPERVDKILKNEKYKDKNELDEAHKELVERFKKGIDTWKLQYNPIDYPEFNVDLGEVYFRENKLYTRNPFKKETIHLHKFQFGKSSDEINIYCQEVYQNIKAQNENKEVRLLLELYEKDMIAFIKKLNDHTSNLCNYPIYAKFDFKEFWSIFKKAKNSQLVAFGLHLEKRYPTFLSQNQNPERPFFSTLKEKLNQEKEKFKNPLYINFDETVIRYLLKKVVSILTK